VVIVHSFDCTLISLILNRITNLLNLRIPLTLFQVFNRANHFMPRQRPGEYEYQYKKRLSQVWKKTPKRLSRIRSENTEEFLIHLFFNFFVTGYSEWNPVGNSIVKQIVLRRKEEKKRWIIVITGKRVFLFWWKNLLLSCFVILKKLNVNFYPCSYNWLFHIEKKIYHNFNTRCNANTFYWICGE